MRLAGYAAAGASLLCSALDLTGLTALAWFTVNAPGAVALVPAALAAAASLVRLPAAALASRRCLAALGVDSSGGPRGLAGKPDSSTGCAPLPFLSEPDSGNATPDLEPAAEGVPELRLVEINSSV